jgi:hypothetical protein
VTYFTLFRQRKGSLFFRGAKWSKVAHQRHWLCNAAMVLLPVSAPIEVFV